MNGLRQLFFCGAVAVGVIGLVPSGVVQAQDVPCTEEIQTYCATVQPGGGRIAQCLKANETKLSSACVKRLNDLLAAFSGPVGAVCREDWATLCYHPHASTDRQAMLQCLQVNQAKVSAGCQRALQNVSGKGQQRREMMP